MRKIISLVLAGFVLLSFAACQKEIPGSNEANKASLRTITAVFENNDTKTTLDTDEVTPLWSVGDVIRILDETSYQDVTLTSGMISGSTVTFTTTLSGETLYAVYPASTTSLTSCSDGNVTFTIPATQDGTFASANICVAKGTADTDKNVDLVFSNATAVLEFSQTASTTGVLRIGLAAANDIAGTLTATFDSDNKATVTASGLKGKTIWTTTVPSAVDKYYIAVAPVETGAVSFTSFTASQDASESKATKTLEKNNIYELTIPTTGYEDSFVTIGGVKWAKMNLGATTIAGSYDTCIGDYYQWGSVNTLYSSKSWYYDYEWHLSALWKDGKSSGFEMANREYTTNANLPDANDVVKQTIGNGWRMPVPEDFQALYDACINGSYDSSTKPGKDTSVGKGVYWCDNYDSVAGVLFCDGTNKVFFPAASFTIGNEEYSMLNNGGNNGFYWSSKVLNSSSALAMDFYSTMIRTSTDLFSFYGCPVRAVYDPAPALPDGALSGEFSVASDKQVHFSQGNLIATIDNSGAPTAWKFATNQYDYIGEGGANKTIGTAYGGVDLFGWVGSSSSLPQYGICASSSDSAYGNVLDESLKSDWGTAIDGIGTWRTLTTSEWQYLFGRTVNGGMGEGKSYQRATINSDETGVYGMILYPDNYTAQTAATSYTSSEWATMETAGCVFLPAAGYRDGSDVSYVGERGNYWSSSSSSDDESAAFDVHFRSDKIIPNNEIYRSNGNSVRLVTDIE